MIHHIKQQLNYDVVYKLSINMSIGKIQRHNQAKQTSKVLQYRNMENNFV